MKHVDGPAKIGFETGAGSNSHQEEWRWQHLSLGVAEPCLPGLRAGSVVSAAAQQQCTAGKGKREGLLQSFLLPGVYFIPKMTLRYASGYSEKKQVLQGKPRFWSSCSLQFESGLS